jgi:hypothetical protein
MAYLYRASTEVVQSVKELQPEHESGAGSPVKGVPERKILVAISEAEVRIRGCEKGCLRTAEISDKKIARS